VNRLAAAVLGGFCEAVSEAKLPKTTDGK